MGFPPLKGGINSFGVDRQRLTEMLAMFTQSVHIGLRLINFFFKRTYRKYF